MSHIDLNRMSEVERDPTKPLEAESSLGELLSRLTTDLSGLLTTQLEIAKAELKEEAAQVGQSAGMLTGSGLAAYLAATLLSFAAAWGLDEVIPAGLAFLIVGLVWLIVAGTVYAAGRRQLRAVRIAPQTKAAIKEDVQWAKQQKN